jgi:hypothetical protein
MPFYRRGLRLVIDTDGRKFRNLANAGAFRGIDKYIHYLQLIWQQRWQKKDFLNPFECPGKCLLVFKVEWRECNVRAKLFSRFGLIAHPRPHSYALFGKSLCYIAPDRAGRAGYQDRFTHKFLLHSVTRSRKIDTTIHSSRTCLSHRVIAAARRGLRYKE